MKFSKGWIVKNSIVKSGNVLTVERFLNRQTDMSAIQAPLRNCHREGLTD